MSIIQRMKSLVSGHQERIKELEGRVSVLENRLTRANEDNERLKAEVNEHSTAHELANIALRLSLFKRRMQQINKS